MGGEDQAPANASGTGLAAHSPSRSIPLGSTALKREAFLAYSQYEGGAAMKLILALSGALVVAACSSLPMQVAENNSPMICDRAQMQRIEAQAMAARVEVRWLNCPQIRRDRVKPVS
jgi:hypothetical protein